MSSFDVAKVRCLEGLLDGANDRSPKGSIDVPVLDMFRYINALQDYYTLSSCSGRISLYQDLGRSKGVHWVLVEHGTVSEAAFKAAVEGAVADGHNLAVKCEPMILHVRCRTRKDAAVLYQVAMDAGFRESGIGGSDDKIMVAIRTTANMMEVPLSQGSKLMVDDAALDFYVAQANRRLLAAFARNDIFFHKLKRRFHCPVVRALHSGTSSCQTSDGEKEKGVLHAATVSTCVARVVSGGRRAMNAIGGCDFLRVYSVDGDQCVAVKIAGEEPSPRWGHTLTAVPHKDTFVLHGGRDGSAVFSDSFLLTLSMGDGGQARAHWTRLSCETSSAARFFHAAVCLVHHGTRGTVLLVTGGLSDLVSVSVPPGPAIAAWELDLSRAPSLSLVDVECDEGTALARFGHHMTHVGAKCVLVTGGNSFESERATVYAPLLAVDYLAGPAAQLILRALEVQSLGDFCGACRAHHSVHVSSEGPYGLTHRVSLTGGTSQCLGIGRHECSPLVLSVGVTDAAALLGATTTTGEAVPTTATTADSVDSLEVLLAPSRRVKPVKNVLERFGLLDKSFKIVKAADQNEGDAGGASPPETVHVLMDLAADAVNGYDNGVTEMQQPPMALPLTAAFRDTMSATHSDSGALKAALATALDSATCTIRTMALVTRSAGFAASKVQQARIFLADCSERLGVPEPKGPFKFELVGDVLMVPEHALIEDVWNVPSVWAALAAIFGAGRVARKAKIDSGLLRQSCVLMLYPALGRPDTTGPGSPGWVTVVENKLPFSFDITRVMFCSGNVTERMRAARHPVKDEVIVDLYCGIGYYTVPFLAHGHAAFVHACEWNEDSVLSLRENLRNAHGGDVSGRCTVYQGDNRLTVEQHPGLHDAADRVSLGLLPSSVEGWPLAVRCLKPTGGVLHIHENVDERQRTQWLGDTCREFERLFAAAGKPMTAQCFHLEKVKSYAPHIDHVVADVRMTPTP